MKLSTFILFLLFYAMQFAGVSNPDTTLTLNDKKWERAKEDINYTENYKERDKPEKSENEAASSTSSPWFQTDLSGLKYLFYFVVLVLIVIIIVRVLANLNGNPTLSGSKITVETIHEIEDKILKIDLDKLLKEAIHANNLEVALRINFLIIIKTLAENNEIEWTQEKTNWEYYSELKTKTLQQEFKLVVNNFELVWYGERKVNQQEFLTLKSYYDSFIKKIAPGE
ncbi:MAG: hypothetical protein JKY42_05080 [Flavobacteriales bacterium]|nr:hypothetical protein [Flavobacteriales bacterium]